MNAPFRASVPPVSAPTLWAPSPANPVIRATNLAPWAVCVKVSMGHGHEGMDSCQRLAAILEEGMSGPRRAASGPQGLWVPQMDIG